MGDPGEKGVDAESSATTTPVPTVRVKSEPEAKKDCASDDGHRGAYAPPTTTASAGITSKTTAATVVAPIQQQQQQQHTRVGQQVITSYFSGGKNGGNEGIDDKKVAGESEEKKTPPIDLESIRGIFGWTTLEGVHVPFILRQGDKYTAVRIIERSLLKKYLQALPPDVYSCTYIKSYFITINEAKLLNEINIKHCDRQFGQEHFTAKDLVVQLTDVVQLHKFLATCYEKLIRKSSSSLSSSSLSLSSSSSTSRCQSSSATEAKKCDPCGIVKIDGTPVPYVTRDHIKYVPLSLFEAQMQSLETKAEKLEHWEMAYLKFCCRVAAVGHRFLEQNAPLIVSLDEVKLLADPSVKFVDWWPSGETNHSNQGGKCAKEVPLLPAPAARQASTPTQQQQQQRHASSTISYYEDMIRKHVHSETGNKVMVAPTIPAQTESRLISSIPVDASNAAAAINRAQMDLSMLRYSSYPLQETQPQPQPPTPLPAHTTKPYVFNEQWRQVGAAASRSFAASTNVPPPRTMPAHSSHAPAATHSAPTNLPYVGMAPTHNQIYDYLQGLQQIMTKDGGWRLPFQSTESSRLTTAGNHAPSNHSTFPKSTPNSNSEENGYPYWGTANNHQSNLSCGFDHLSDKSPSYADRNMHGTPTSLSNQSMHPVVDASEHGLMLATRIDEAIYNRTALHQHVVAPSVGNSQFVTSKMTSPKMAHQVPPPPPPTSVVASDVAAPFSNRSRVARDKSSMSQHIFSSAASKLQELLQANESGNGTIKANRLDSLLCDIKEIVIGGIRFYGVHFSTGNGGSTLMVPVKEIEIKVKPHTAVHVCEHILRKILKVELFQCNRGQGEILRKKLKYLKDLQRPTALTLIRADDLKICLSRLISALTQLQTCDDLSSSSSSSAPVAKKPRHMEVSI